MLRLPRGDLKVFWQLRASMTATCRGRRPRSRASRSVRSGVPGAAMESLSIIDIGGETRPRACILSRRNGRDGGGQEVPGKRLRGIQNLREREAARFRRRPGLREGVLGTNAAPARVAKGSQDRKSTRLNSSHLGI